jgi:hypothetical protein
MEFINKQEKKEFLINSSIALAIIAIESITTVYGQEQDPKNITKILSCEYGYNRDTGEYDYLLCHNPEMDLCAMRIDNTDIGGGMTWTIANPMLCEAD